MNYFNVRSAVFSFSGQKEGFPFCYSAESFYEVNESEAE